MNHKVEVTSIYEGKIMKKILTAVLLLSSSYAFAGFGDCDRDRDGRSTDALYDRIRRLEDDMHSLERRLSRLEDHGSDHKRGRRYTCTLTVFGKLFTDSAWSKSEATAKVMHECVEAGNHAMHCSESSVKCSDK